MKIYHFLLVLVCFSFTSSARRGLTLVNSAVNFPVPQMLAERTLWGDAAFIQYKLDLLAGCIIEKPNSTAKWLKKQQIIPKSFSLTPTVLADGPFYHSIVDRGISGSGSGAIPIMSVAASLSDQQRMDLTIEDVAMLVVDDKDIPWTEIRNYTAKNPLPKGTSRAWVQGVMLTKMYMDVAVETSANSTVSGMAFQVGGKVYNKNTIMQRQPYITMLMVDLSEESKLIAPISAAIDSISAISNTISTMQKQGKMVDEKARFAFFKRMQKAALSVKPKYYREVFTGVDDKALENK